MKKISTVIILLFLLVAAVYGGSPYYNAYLLKSAYDAKEGATIAAAISYEHVRPSMQQQLTEKFSDTIVKYPLVAELGGAPLKQAANEFIIKSVNDAITPQNIEQLINTQGQANTATKELAAVWAIASNQVDLQGVVQDIIIQRGDVNAVIKNQIQNMMNKQANQLERQVAQGEDSAKPRLKYCGINCVTISGQAKGYPITVEMQRLGLIEWRIVDIILP